MAWGVRQVRERTVIFLPADGSPIASEADAAVVVAAALEAGAQVVAIPASRLGPEVWRLASGVAGALFQKLENYRLRAVVFGDIGRHVAASKAVADWVREANRGRTIGFVPDAAAVQDWV